jgi:hypothetical protein
VAASLGAAMKRPRPNAAAAIAVILKDIAMILLLHDADYGQTILKTSQD